MILKASKYCSVAQSPLAIGSVPPPPATLDKWKETVLRGGLCSWGSR